MDPQNGTQNGTQNDTSDYEYDDEDTSCNISALITFSLVITCVAFVVGTVGNGLVVYVTGCRMKKTVNTVWFLNLALADFLFTAFLLISIVRMFTWPEWILGDLMCKLNTLVYGLNMFASILVLSAISLDRCLAVCVPVWAQNRRTPRTAELTCVAIWLAALVCSLPLTIFRRVVAGNDGRMHCSLGVSSYDQYRKLVIFRFVVGFLIPFLVIIGSNVAIWVRTRQFQRRRRRSTRIIIAVILAFFTCWLPFHTFQFLASQPELAGLCVVRVGDALSTILAFLNSCVNPVLYVFMCSEFQQKLRQSVCLVFESALAEDTHGSFRSSRMSRKDSHVPTEKRGTSVSLATSSDKV